jgi:hypothetical protein
MSVIHKERLLRKSQQLDLARGLLETWEAKLPPHDPYIAHLASRVRRIENQLRNMKP